MGTLCTHANINKWAIYKPEKSNKLFLKKSDRIANKCGFTPKTCPTLKSHIYPVCANSDTRTKNTSELGEWTYQKPTGGASSPYRLGDFLDLKDDGTVSTDGYNHNAVAPDNGWSNLSLDLSNVKNVCNGTFTTSGTGEAWTMGTSNSFVFVNNVNFRFEETSASNMGSANSSYMPLSYITGNANMTSSEYWRLAILVWIPYSLAGGKANYWVLFTGRKPIRAISSTTSIGDMLPNLASNQYGAELLKYNRETKNVTSFTYVPVLVRNCTSTTVSMNGQKQCLTLSTSDSNAIIYSMPSGASELTLYISNSSGHAYDSSDTNKFSGMNIYYKIGVKSGVTWYIGFRATGVTGGYQTVYNIYLITDSTSSVSATITGTLNYISNPTGTTGSATNRQKVYSNQTITANTAVACKAGGGNYYGYSIDGGVGLGYVSCDMTLK